LVEAPDLDAVLVFSSWTSHIEIAIAAMKAGKRVAIEVGGATSIDSCWRLVHTSEETGIPCMLLENCCYGRNEMALLRMIKENLFGELIHCEGGYEHDLRDEIACGIENRHYRFKNYQNRNGENYPTHELGPMAKYLGINRGNRLVSLVSMASKSRGLHKWILDHKGEEDPTAQTVFAQGDVVTTMIRCAGGETITLTLDTCNPRPYSRGGRVQGTKGIWMADNASIYLEGTSPTPHEWEKWEPYLEKYEHPLWVKYQADGLVGGHDGMDYLVLSAFIDSVARQIDPPIDVYDAATWMCITTLSEQSIALGSAPVTIPDFTDGRWFEREDVPDSIYRLDAIPQVEI
jgi:predicted dehydrogenase